MALNIDYDGDIAQTVTDLPRTFTWSGSDYTAIIDPINNEKQTDGMNYRDVTTFMIVVQTSKFTGTRPAINDKITISSIEYRISGVEVDEADAGMNIQIVEVD